MYGWAPSASSRASANIRGQSAASTRGTATGGGGTAGTAVCISVLSHPPERVSISMTARLDEMCMADADAVHQTTRPSASYCGRRAHHGAGGSRPKVGDPCAEDDRRRRRQDTSGVCEHILSAGNLSGKHRSVAEILDASTQSGLIGDWHSISSPIQVPTGPRRARVERTTSSRSADITSPVDDGAGRQQPGWTEFAQRGHAHECQAADHLLVQNIDYMFGA